MWKEEITQSCHVVGHLPLLLLAEPGLEKYLPGKNNAAMSLCCCAPFLSLQQNLSGLTPLHVAAAAGHAETCASMLGALAPGPRAAALAATDEASGETAFHLACVEGRADCVRSILCEVWREGGEGGEGKRRH